MIENASLLLFLCVILWILILLKLSKVLSFADNLSDTSLGILIAISGTSLGLITWLFLISVPWLVLTFGATAGAAYWLTR
jgi:hypothetical protein